MDQDRPPAAPWLCLIAACWLTAACSREEPRDVVATTTTQREAIEIASVLDRGEVPGVRVQATRTGGRELHEVTTPAFAASASRLALAESGLPRPARSDAGESTAFFPTRADEAERERRRRGAELERALELLDGVTVASVVVAASPAPDGTIRAASPPRLLVTLRTAGMAGTAAESPLRDRAFLAVRSVFPELNPASDATIVVAGRAEPTLSPAAKEAMAGLLATKGRDRSASGLETIDRSIMAVAVTAMLALAWLQWRMLRRGVGGNA